MLFKEVAIEQIPNTDQNRIPDKIADDYANDYVFDLSKKDPDLEKKDFVEYSKQINEFLDTTLDQHKHISSNQLESIKKWFEIDHSPEINEKIENIIIQKIKQADEINSQTFLLLNNLFDGKFYNYKHLQYFISHDENIDRTTIKQLMYYPSDKNSQINTLELLNALKNFTTQAGTNRISVNERGKPKDDLIDEYKQYSGYYGSNNENEKNDKDEYIKEKFESFQAELFFYLEEKKRMF